MSTTVRYKDEILVTVENSTKVLTTSGTWLEDDITLVDESLDVSNSTVTGSDVALGKIFYDANGIERTGALIGTRDKPRYHVIDNVLYVEELDDYSVEDKGLYVTI